VSWKKYDEPVDMEQRRFRYFPLVFRWRGRRFEVDTVERSWLGARSRWLRTPDLRFFRLCVPDGQFEVYHDLIADTWHLRRARLQPTPVPALRQGKLSSARRQRQPSLL
jgi:hypothetical protein